jgi:hypothetical protein
MRYRSFEQFSYAHPWVEDVLDWVIPICGGVISASVVYFFMGR